MKPEMKLAFSAAAFVAIILSLAVPASAASVLFEDTFTGVADGTLLSTQSGYSNHATLPQVFKITNEQGDGTQDDAEHEAYRTWSIDGTAPQYVLSMDLVQESISMVIRVRGDATGGGTANLTQFRNNQDPAGAGEFDGNAGMGNTGNSPSGVSGPVHMKWTMNASPLTISQSLHDINTGALLHSWGPTDISGQIDSITDITNIRLSSDARGGNSTGFLFDNLKLESIPEPTTCTLLGIGLLMLFHPVMRNRVRRRG